MASSRDRCVAADALVSVIDMSDCAKTARRQLFQLQQDADLHIAKRFLQQVNLLLPPLSPAFYVSCIL
jgi:hypothetical protein